MMSETKITFFAPELYIRNGVHNVDFYKEAFGAEVLREFKNEDESLHVVELSINGAMFHLHEETSNSTLFSPEKHEGTSVLIGLFVSDVDSFMEQAKANGATETRPAQSYDYGYRQGVLKDPFGHYWMIQQKI